MCWQQIPVAIFALLFAVFAPALAMADKRVALVIGNSAYQFAPELKNPKNDAASIAKSLEAVSFEVIKGIDLDGAAMQLAVNSFAEKLQTADVALLFYAGHGLQVDGANYLLPINGQLRNKIDLQFQGVRLDFLLSLMESAERTSIVLLDACRDNPLAETLARSLGTRSGSVGRGLAKIETGVGTYISFSTQPGNVALDGDGTNSPFATALLKNLDKEGLDIKSMMRLVRADVMAVTKNQQIPWGNSSLVGGGFFFKKPEAKPEAQPQSEVKAPDKQDNSVELAYWDSIKASAEKSYFEAYLQQYPNGAFANLAKLKIASLEKATAKEQAEAERKAVDDAKNAEQERLATLKAETERLAKEKAEAELRAKELAAQKAKEDAQKEIEVAKLEEPAVKPETEALSRSIDPADLALETQKELQRLGCLSGKIDGNWGDTSQKALKEYSGRQGIKLASLEPSAEALDRLKATTVRVCPLVCGKGLEEKNGRCEKVRQEANIERKPEPRTPSKSDDEKKATAPAEKSKNTKQGSNDRECYVCLGGVSNLKGTKVCIQKGQPLNTVTNDVNSCRKI